MPNLHFCFTNKTKQRLPSSPSDHTLIKNYNSLYDSSNTSSTEPDFATAVASQRFFFTSPGKSNSIVEEMELRKCPTVKVKDSVAVPTPTYSPDPYVDFRDSMREMVEARDFRDLKSKWDYLHELLLCYLALNPKNTHKFIIGAFADLVVTLLSSSNR